VSKTGTIQIGVNVYGDGAAYSNTVSLSDSTASGTEQSLSLTAATDLVLSTVAPAEATYMIVLSVSAGTLLGKGASGDTGITLAVGSVNAIPARIRNASSCTVLVAWI
jgi:hypothetical protein